MNEHLPRRKQDISGALLEWERRGSTHGVIVTLHIAESGMGGGFHSVSMALNDRQLRAFTRDLNKASRARGIVVEIPKPLRTRLWNRIKSLFN